MGDFRINEEFVKSYFDDVLNIFYMFKIDEGNFWKFCRMLYCKNFDNKILKRKIIVNGL